MSHELHTLLSSSDGRQMRKIFFPSFLLAIICFQPLTALSYSHDLLVQSRSIHRWAR